MFVMAFQVRHLAHPQSHRRNLHAIENRISEAYENCNDLAVKCSATRRHLADKS